MKRSSLWTLAVLALATTLAACDSASEIAAPEIDRPEFAFTVGETTKVIRQGGGVLQLGDHLLFVPAGAITRPTTFRMATSVPGPTSFSIELTAWDAQGPVVEFKKSLTLSVSYSDLPIESASLYRLDADGPADITIWDNTRAKRVYGATDHFTEFLIGDL